MNRPELLFGCVLVKLTGTGAERFLNLSAARGIEIFDVRKGTGECLYFFTSPQSFKDMKPLAKKAGVRLRIQKKSGPAFLLFRLRKHLLFAAGFLSFFVVLWFLSLFIWDISIEGNRMFTEETLLHYLETLPVSCGMRRDEISCSRLEEAIRNQFPEITWVSAEITGTRLRIQIRENETPVFETAPDPSPCSLEAASDGVIVKTVVRNGIPMVKAGDTVTEGQLLISGTIPIYDDSETLVNSHNIRADGEVYARTERSVRFSFPLSAERKSYTGSTRFGLHLELFGHSISFLLPDLSQPSSWFSFLTKKESAGSWDVVSEQHQLKLFRNFYLPVYGSVITAREYVPYEEYYTKEQIQDLCRDRFQTYTENLTEKGIQILRNNAKIEKDKSGWQAEYVLSVVEDIAKEVPILEKQEEIQTLHEHY